MHTKFTCVRQCCNYQNPKVVGYVVAVSFVELSTLVYPISKSGPTQTSVLVFQKKVGVGRGRTVGYPGMYTGQNKTAPNQALNQPRPHTRAVMASLFKVNEGRLLHVSCIFLFFSVRRA